MQQATAPTSVSRTSADSPKQSSMSSLLSTAKSAAQLAAKQAEKTKLTTITLPSQYQPLGKHGYESQQYRAEFADLFQKLDAVRSQLAAVATSTEGKPTPQTLGDKAKAAAGKAMQAAQSQKLVMQQSSLYGALGKAVYEAHGENSGPLNLTGPIAASLSRLADLDADISRLSSEGKGSWITPKRLAIAAGVAACLLVMAVISNVLTGPKQDAANKTIARGTHSEGTAGQDSASDGSTSQQSLPDFAQADYSFDFSNVNYTPVDFSPLDYSKGPKGEIIEALFDQDVFDVGSKKFLLPYTQQGFVNNERVTADQAQWQGLRQEQLQTAWKAKQFVPHGYRWVWLRNNAPTKPSAETENALRRQGKGPPPGPKYPDAKLIEQQWFNGEPHGRFAEWSEDGKLLEEFFMVQGKQTGKRVGYWPDGTKQLEEWWLNGHEHGIHKRWHQDGSLKEEGMYVEGKQHGKWVFWQDNEKKLQEQSWVNGVEHGIFITYHPNGMKKAEFAMLNGKEQPGQREWDNQGKDMRAVVEEQQRDRRERIGSLQAQVAKNGFTFRMLAADPELFNSSPGDFQGQLKKHPAGSVADLLQAVALAEGEVMVWYVSGSKDLRQYASLGKYLCVLRPRMLPKSSYEEIFGPPKNMRTVKDRIGFNGDIPIDGQIWELPCADGRVFVRAMWGGPVGDNLGQMINIHFDSHVDGICPTPRELIKRSRPGR